MATYYFAPRYFSRYFFDVSPVSAAPSGPSLEAESAALTVVSAAAALLAARIIGAGAGSRSVTGRTTNLLAGRYLGAEDEAWLASGSSASLLAARKLASNSSSFSTSGFPLDLFLLALSFLLEDGATASAGLPVDLIAARMLRSDQAVLALTSRSAAILAGRRLPIDPADFDLTGASIDRTIARRLWLLSGLLTATGGSAGLLRSVLFEIDPALAALSDREVELLAHRLVRGERTSILSEPRSLDLSLLRWLWLRADRAELLARFFGLTLRRPGIEITRPPEPERIPRKVLEFARLDRESTDFRAAHAADFASESPDGYHVVRPVGFDESAPGASHSNPRASFVLSSSDQYVPLDTLIEWLLADLLLSVHDSRVSDPTEFLTGAKNYDGNV